MSYRRAKPLISRSSALTLAVLALCGFLPANPSDRAPSGEPADPSATIKQAEWKTEIAGYTQLIKEAVDQIKWPLADHFLTLLVNLPCSDLEKKAALREIAESYERGGQLAKAVAVQEKIIALFPQDPDLPDLFLKAGLIYQKIGANDRAISRFYSVLNTALKASERNITAHRDLSQRAQIEIAETNFAAGNYQQALKFYELLMRSDLSDDQRRRIEFRRLHCKYLLGDTRSAAELAGTFLANHPDYTSVPEIRYLLASALRADGKTEESLNAVLALLREEKARRDAAPDRWAYWQKKSGNEFANEYYRRGDYVKALTIYQALAKLEETPDWQWPVIYQMGLCFERLGLPGRAAEAYKYIIDQSKAGETPPALPASLGSLVENARWRGEQIVWRSETDKRLQSVLGQSQTAGTRSPAQDTSSNP
jgi:tetratricopeptide (TPR) repeat protein